MRLELLLLRIAEGFLIFLVVVGHHEQVLSETLFLGAEHFADVFSIQLINAVIIIIIAAIVSLLIFFAFVNYTIFLWRLIGELLILVWMVQRLHTVCLSRAIKLSNVKFDGAQISDRI